MNASRTPSLVLSSLGRRPARTVTLLVAVAVVVGMQVAAYLLDRASRRGLERGIEVISRGA